MKKTLIILTVVFANAFAAEEVKQPEMVNPFGVRAGKPGTGLDSWVSKIDLTTHHTVNDAVKQIIAGLPPEERSLVVVEIPEEDLAKMPIKGDLRVRNVPLRVAMAYLDTRWPVGYRFWNNELHICKERADDIVTVKYRLSQKLLEQLGIVFGPSQTFTTKGGRMWPPESEWSATYAPLDADAGREQDDAGPASSAMGVLRLRAARSFHDEFSAVLLLKERGYHELSLARP